MGRHPIAVSDVSAMSENGFGMSNLGGPLNPEDPTIEPFGSKKWFVQMAALEAAVAASAAVKAEWNKPLKVWMVVTPSVGKTKRTKQSITITPRGSSAK
jgi:hypothetical protein